MTAKATTVVAPAKGQTFGMAEVAREFGVTLQHIRNLEKNGIIKPLPRTVSNARCVPFEVLQDWRAHGMPGKNGRLPHPGAIVPVAPVAPSDVGSPAGPRIAIDSTHLTAQPGPVAQSDAVSRAEDEIKLMKLELERKRVVRELERFEKDSAHNGEGQGATQALLLSMMQQNTEMIKAVMDRSATQRDPLEVALQVLKVAKETAQPVDLNNRPEGRMFNLMAEKIVSRFADTALDGSSEAPSGLTRIVEGALPILAGIIQNSNRQPSVPVNGKGGTAGALPPVPDVAALPAPKADPQSGNGEGADLSALGEIFDSAGNMYGAGLPVDEAARALAVMLGPEPGFIMSRVLRADTGVLTALAVASGSEPAVTALKQTEGQEWFTALQATLRQAYGME